LTYPDGPVLRAPRGEGSISTSSDRSRVGLLLGRTIGRRETPALEYGYILFARASVC